MGVHRPPDGPVTRLPRSFFQRDLVACARELIGCELRWDQCAGVIVETEAYAALNDEACHTFHRPSARAFVATHVAGTAYVYFNYGMYWLFNVLVKGGTEDGFVLIRALEPTVGLAKMEERRGVSRKKGGLPVWLCSGPGKLTIALGISGDDHGRDLCASGVNGFHVARKAEVVADVRVGISKAKDFPWRFLEKGSPYVSARPKVATAPA